ncbi:MAG: alpha/beta hydrolase, partial [Steroidobacteraceae bacterium]
PRQFEDPSTKVADLRGAVRFLQRTPGVDGARIYGLGVCYGASLIADAARREPGFKGIATVAAWLHDRPSLMATYTPDGYALRESRGREAQAKFKETGTVEYIPAYSNDTLAAMAGPFDYYSNPSRGVIPQWSPRFATMSFEGWLKHEAAGYAREIKQPVLMIHSDGSALPDNVRRFHADLPNPGKKLHWTTGDHVDFYDHAELIEPAVREIGAFFKSL